MGLNVKLKVLVTLFTLDQFIVNLLGYFCEIE